MDHIWSISKCKRVLRPFISSVHAVSELFESYPANSIFEIERFVALCLEESDDRTRLMYPENSMARLHSLKPFVSSDLHTKFKDIYSTLKTLLLAISTTNPSLSVGPESGSMPLLSGLCCFLYGQSMATYSKTSYYQLNNKILFDNDDQDVLDDEDNEVWTDEIDTWLELEPRFLIEPMRTSLILGYVIHLLVLHLERLAPLITVLIQLVYETSSDPFYRIIARKLFHEYWKLQSLSKSDLVQKQFIMLLDSGYWAAYLPSIGAKSSSITSASSSLKSSCNYYALIMDAVPLTRLKLHQMEKPLRGCVGHKRSNLILVSILSTMVEDYRYKLKTEPETATDYIIRSIRRFLTIWLDDATSPQVFDSLQQGNEDIFSGLVRLTRYARRKMGSYGSETILIQLTAYEQAILILGCFYLGRDGLDMIGDIGDLEMCSHLIASVHGPAKKVEGSSAIDFIEWLVHVDERKFEQLAYWVFKQHFGVSLHRWNHLVKQLYQNLKLDINGAVSFDLDDILDDSDDGMLVIDDEDVGIYDDYIDGKKDIGI